MISAESQKKPQAKAWGFFVFAGARSLSRSSLVKIRGVGKPQGNHCLTRIIVCYSNNYAFVFYSFSDRV